MKEIYQCIFNIITTPDAPKPYRDLRAFLRQSGREVEADGVTTLLKNAFDENEEPESALFELGKPGGDDQNPLECNPVGKHPDRG